MLGCRGSTYGSPGWQCWPATLRWPAERAGRWATAAAARCRVFERVTVCQLLFRLRIVAEVDVCGEVVRIAHVGDHEGDVRGALPSGVELVAETEPGGQRALDQRRVDEIGPTRPVRQLLEPTRSLLRSALHDHDVAATNDVDELVRVCAGAQHLRRVRQQSVGADDVVSVLGAVGGNVPVEDDPGRFVNAELGALDEVGEVGLEERQELVPAGIGRVNWRVL